MGLDELSGAQRERRSSVGRTDRNSETGPLDGPGRGRESKRRRQQAGFSVFLDQVVDAGETSWETRLYHAESGAETTLPGVAPDQWISWILDRLQPAGMADVPLAGATSRTAVEVASVEILDVTIEEDAPADAGSLRTMRAQLVVQLSGVAGLEREIGSRVLRGIADPGRNRSPPGQRPGVG
jgi:hypothetical protein